MSGYRDYLIQSMIPYFLSSKHFPTQLLSNSKSAQIFAILILWMRKFHETEYYELHFEYDTFSISTVD